MRVNRTTWLIALVAFVAALAGVFVGRMVVVKTTPVESTLHSLLHEQTSLDANQQARIADIEARFAIRKKALEQELRNDNSRLAGAIAKEKGYGPEVSRAVDHSHHVMGQLQKETLEHIFAMRDVMHADQAEKFDAAVIKALTARNRAD